MSAVLKDDLQLEKMGDADLEEVLEIEAAVYTHPWSHGNFADSLRAAYQCWTWRRGGELIGYFVMMVAAGEAHLLNLSIAEAEQRRGHGSALLTQIMRMAKSRGADNLFLEVRPSNQGAKALYRRFGFRQVAVRSGYYPANSGREDALVLSLPL